MTTFHTQMNKRGVGKALQCKLFSATFTDSTLVCDVAFQVINPNPKVLVSAFEEGLRPRPFNESLVQKLVASMDEIRLCAECYEKGEESNAEKRNPVIISPLGQSDERNDQLHRSSRNWESNGKRPLQRRTNQVNNFIGREVKEMYHSGLMKA
ncbi:hypothetical protein SESBI_24752 [Sesbania bispinosa]|nr:hypothetical protein SESBI_24752 [Sesbania bispinosa]